MTEPRDPVVDAALAAVRWEEMRRRDELAGEKRLAFLRRGLPSTTRIVGFYEPDRDTWAIRFVTGGWCTLGRVLWVSVDVGMSEAAWRCAMRTAQKHVLELAHQRGGYS